MDRWKEYIEELLNVKCERHTGDGEEDIQKQKKEMRDEVILIEEVMKAVHILKRKKASRHYNITPDTELIAVIIERLLYWVLF